MNEQTQALVLRLRHLEAINQSSIDGEAADLIEAQAKEIEALRAELGGAKQITQAWMARALRVDQDAARYQLLRRGQHWGVIDGVGDELRGEKLDIVIDAAMQQKEPG